MAEHLVINPTSGFCASEGIFYSKRKPVVLPPPNVVLDVATFISSFRPHSPDQLALIDATTGDHLTYSQLWSFVCVLASGLSSSLRISRGDVVFILSPNSIHFPVVFLAALSVGAIVTTSNPLNNRKEIQRQVGDSRPSLAFVSTALVPKIDGLGIPVVLMDSDGIGVGRGSRVPTVVTMQELIVAGAAGCTTLRSEQIRLDDTATLLYSSGTTGLSKGVESSHRSLMATAVMVVGRFRLEEGPQTFLCQVPMFHVYGLTVMVLGAIASGSTVVVLSSSVLEDAVSAIQRYRVIYFPLVPPILSALLTTPIADRYDLSLLRTVLSGGSPLSLKVATRFSLRFPWVALFHGYAMTETSGMGASFDTVEESKRIGSIVLLSPNMKARVVHPETGRSLSENRRGELWLWGPCVMKGYFSNPEATALVLDSDGWLRTGDLCYFDDDGYLFVVDRLKELIKFKGNQVPPAELEALLLSHPEISDAAVIPYPDEVAGQIPMAYVVKRNGSNMAEGEVMKFIADQVAPYKKIRKVSFVGRIPKNPSGKILRKDLIQLATSKL